MKLRVNMLCLIGIIVGFVAMVSVWRFEFFASPHFAYDFPQARIETGFTLLSDSVSRLWNLNLTTFYIGVLLAALGVMVAFVTPLGGVLEVIGACLFLSVTPSGEFVGAIHGSYYFLRIGPFIALISGSLMVLSMVLPVVLNRGLPPSDRWRLLWTFKVNHKDSETMHGRVRLLETDLASWAVFRTGRARLLFAIVLATILIASVSLSLNDMYSKESAKIAVHVICDTSEAADFSIYVDGRLTYYSSTGEILRNYYVQAGEHHVSLAMTSPTRNESSFDIHILPFQTVVIVVQITDTTWVISRT